MAEKGFSIKVGGPGMNVSRTVSADVAARVVSIVLGVGGDGGEHSQRETRRETASNGSSGDSGTGLLPSQSLSEFWIKHGAKRAAEKITALGAFVRDIQRSDTFTDLFKIE